MKAVIAKIPKVWRRSSVGLILLLTLTFTLPTPAEEYRNHLQYTRRQAILNTPCEMGTLAAVAQNHAQYMANAGYIYHELLGILWKLPIGWWAAGEIVGSGPDLASIQTTFLNSPTHAAVIRDKRWTHMGTGVAKGANGQLYISVLFVALPQWCGEW